MTNKQIYGLIARQCKAELNLEVVNSRDIEKWLLTKNITTTNRWLNDLRTNRHNGISIDKAKWISEVCSVKVEDLLPTDNLPPSKINVNFVVLKLK